MKTKYIHGQKFVRISYTNHNAHALIETWYPINELRWLASRCDFQIVKN